MPIYYPPDASGASLVSLDPDGFLVVPGQLPVKYEEEDRGGGIVRVRVFTKLSNGQIAQTFHDHDTNA